MCIRDRCKLSFIDLYAKIKKRMAALGVGEIPQEQKNRLAQQFFKIAAGQGIAVSACGTIDLAAAGVPPAKCIDDALISRITGYPFHLKKDPGQRGDCYCCLLYTSVEGLSRYGFFRDITFSVRAKEIVGLCGLTGAGRSEIVKSICGLDPLDEGEIFIEGGKTEIKNYESCIRQGIAYLPEDRKKQGLQLGFSMADNITSAAVSYTHLEPRALPKIF